MLDYHFARCRLYGLRFIEQHMRRNVCCPLHILGVRYSSLPAGTPEKVRLPAVDVSLAERFRANVSETGDLHWRPRRVTRCAQRRGLRIEWTLDVAPGHPQPVDQIYVLQAELIRAFTPSTERQGSTSLVYGKRGVAISDLYVVGNYALRISFDDGHDTGIFSYAMLHEMGRRKWQLSREYINALRALRKTRDPHRRKSAQ